VRKFLAPKSITLGEELSENSGAKSDLNIGTQFRKYLTIVIKCFALAYLSMLAIWWFLGQPDVDKIPTLMFLTALTIFWWFVNRKVFGKKSHFLLDNDRQGFMHDLRLDEKAAIIDGSNIYHLGHDNKLDAQPLVEIAHQLRSEGYRIVCFFDANIFHTLGEHGAIRHDKRHSLAILEDLFGLMSDEIYVVPSGVQADKYILECLKYMPICFAVTNDRFRDYANQYPTVMKDHLWRKGVVISGSKTKLLQHR
jgi:hypothetical protein